MKEIEDARQALEELKAEAGKVPDLEEKVNDLEQQNLDLEGELDALRRRRESTDDLMDKKKASLLQELEELRQANKKLQEEDVICS